MSLLFFLDKLVSYAAIPVPRKISKAWVSIIPAAIDINDLVEDNQIIIFFFHLLQIEKKK